MTTIDHIDAWSVLDSRGRPTVRVQVGLSDGATFVATSPAGASKGAHEAQELRDGGARYGGLGVELAVSFVQHELRAALVGEDPRAQAQIDGLMVDLDGTPDRSRLGANAIVALSMAVARAGAHAAELPLWLYLASRAPEPRSIRLPIPLMNVLNGGLHASGGLMLQECMIVPHGQPSIAERIRCGAEVYAQLRSILDKAGLSTALGDEGGFVFDGDPEPALHVLSRAITDAGYRVPEDVSLAIDAAADNLVDPEGRYTPARGVALDKDGMVAWWVDLCARHPISLLEDPLAEDDWPTWTTLTTDLGTDGMTIVGDDIFVTNAETIAKGAAAGVGNAVLLKVNQVGTVSETIAAARVAREHGYKLVVSHRSGETCDTFIADLAVALGAEYIKAGAPARSERTEKYNRLIEIERAMKTVSA